MSNGNTTKVFLSRIEAKTKNAILSNIANHYGITNDEAYAEIVHDEAEHLCEYVTGNERAATSLLMKRHGLF